MIRVFKIYNIYIIKKINLTSVGTPIINASHTAMSKP